MARLVVNVDHVATVRQARRITEPDPVTAAALAELGGCQGIIVHLREDRRHIQDRDVELLRQTVKTRLHLEMAATEEILAIACRIRPDMACLVPEKRQELTTEGGLDVRGQQDLLTAAVSRLHEAGVAVSLFVDPQQPQIDAACATGCDYIEIHTGRYCDAIGAAAVQQELQRVRDGIAYGVSRGLRVNVGHGLNYTNVLPLAGMPQIDEFSIGHSIIARAVLVGMEAAVRDMVRLVCVQERL